MFICTEASQNSQVMLICTKSSQSCGRGAPPRAGSTGGGIPGSTLEQKNEGVGREGERDKERGGNNKEGKEGRGGSNARTVCTRLPGNATPAPPTSVGDCDVTLGNTRFFALRVNRTVCPSPGDRTDAVPWPPARPRTNCGTAKAPGRTAPSHSSRLARAEGHPQAPGTPVLHHPSAARRASAPGPSPAPPARGPPPRRARWVVRPAPVPRPAPTSCPALALPQRLSSQVSASSSVFVSVHLSVVIVVLTHIALGPVLPSYSLCPTEVQT